MNKFREFVLNPPIKKILLDLSSVTFLEEIQFSHFTGKVILSFEQGHIIGISKEESNAKDK